MMAAAEQRDNRRRGNNRREESQESELIERLLGVNRVSKTTKGGRTMRFQAQVVVGDGNGRVGFASAKAQEVPDAIQKATGKAKRRMFRVPMREGRTLHHDLQGRCGAGNVVLRTAQPGTGIIAGGPMRAIFEALGMHDVVSKSIGSSNAHNMIGATIAALKKASSPRAIAARRGIKVATLLKARDGKITEDDVANNNAAPTDEKEAANG